MPNHITTTTRFTIAFLFFMMVSQVDGQYVAAKTNDAKEIFMKDGLFGVRQIGGRILIQPVMNSITKEGGSNTQFACTYPRILYHITINNDYTLAYSTYCAACAGTGTTKITHPGNEVLKPSTYSVTSKDYKTGGIHKKDNHL